MKTILGNNHIMVESGQLCLSMYILCVFFLNSFPFVCFDLFQYFCSYLFIFNCVIIPYMTVYFEEETETCVSGSQEIWEKIGRRRGLSNHIRVYYIKKVFSTKENLYQAKRYKPLFHHIVKGI